MVLIDLGVWIPLALAHLSGEMLLLLELFGQELLLLLLPLLPEELLLLLLHHVHLHPLLLLHRHHLLHHRCLLLVAHIARRWARPLVGSDPRGHAAGGVRRWDGAGRS